MIELDAMAGEPMDVLVNGYLIAQGEVVVVNDKFGIRLTDIVTPSERMRRLSRAEARTIQNCPLTCHPPASRCLTCPRPLSPCRVRDGARSHPAVPVAAQAQPWMASSSWA